MVEKNTFGLAMPLLAVDTDPSTVKAVFFEPGVRWHEQARCIFPARGNTAFDRDFWIKLARMAGLRQPNEILASCLEGTDEDGLEGRKAFWQGLFQEASGRGIDFAGLLTSSVPARWEKLSALHAATGGDVCDSQCARLMGLLARPERNERSYRHGLCCLCLDSRMTAAYLVFRGRIFGVFEVPSANITAERFLAELEEFRLGWLPLERAAEFGGISFVDVNLPAEAEGFRPLFAIGPEAGKLEGQAKVLSSEGGGVFWGCFGLLHKYAFVHNP